MAASGLWIQHLHELQGVCLSGDASGMLQSTRLESLDATCISIAIAVLGHVQSIEGDSAHLSDSALGAPDDVAFIQDQIVPVSLLQVVNVSSQRHVAHDQHITLTRLPQ